ncbi:hypothetical protein IV203_000993 [Nitzschia inconspicua]|uniref:Uncharacterized protein n=1 Tax=Nitzschia inconspicua TaxID=303405 RepID=A0A9K3PQS0_9STRA|nr:hypothetical protein IV203_000993 [Nitzschia inconspicua]
MTAYEVLVMVENHVKLLASTMRERLSHHKLSTAGTPRERIDDVLTKPQNTVSVGTGTCKLPTRSADNFAVLINEAKENLQNAWELLCTTHHKIYDGQSTRQEESS